MPTGDYVAATTTRLVTTGSRATNVTVTILPDNLREGDETFTIDITATTATVTRASGTVTILDDTDTIEWVKMTGISSKKQSSNVLTTADRRGNAFIVSESTAVKYGPTGKVKLTFLGEYTRFENYTSSGYSETY